MNKTAILTLLLALGLSTAARADFNDGVVAYLMGDYDRAFTTMQSLGETADHGLAQYYMGMMYMQGQGVEQSYKNAGVWFKRSAQNAIPQAQYQLGRLYMQGRGVPKDYEFAYAWFNTGAAHNHQKSIGEIDKTVAKLSEQELAEARSLSEEYIVKYGPQPDVDPTQPIQIN